MPDKQEVLGTFDKTNFSKPKSRLAFGRMKTPFLVKADEAIEIVFPDERG
jgi:hypothetical protein